MVERSLSMREISIDVEHAKCSICLNIYGMMLSLLLLAFITSSGMAAVQFTGRNPFVHHIVEEILLLDPSLKRSSEEIALVDSYATIRSNLVLILVGKSLSNAFKTILR
ncbi:hypothetical protein V6N11_028215 [Hibiscus sabdariffa]|uniref:Uncharacterized protein n=1 Tax=Hibiscus sabdariffa TaxID=183260 RepID=A0ABR2N857_9ROSI